MVSGRKTAGGEDEKGGGYGYEQRDCSFLAQRKRGIDDLHVAVPCTYFIASEQTHYRHPQRAAQQSIVSSCAADPGHNTSEVSAIESICDMAYVQNGRKSW